MRLYQVMEELEQERAQVSKLLVKCKHEEENVNNTRAELKAAQEQVFKHVRAIVYTRACTCIDIC